MRSCKGIQLRQQGLPNFPRFCYTKMSRKAKSAHERVHFTLGNDERVMKSSYQRDFDGIRVFHVPRSPKVTPPIPAPLAVHDDPSVRLYRWFSATQKDFIGFSPATRKLAYESSRGGFRAAMKLQTRDVAVLRDKCGVTSFSKYSLDFRPT